MTKTTDDVEIYDTFRDALQDADVGIDTKRRIEYIRLVSGFSDAIIEASYASSDSSTDYYQKLYDLGLKERIATFGSTHNPNKKVYECNNVKAMLNTHADIATIFGKTWTNEVRILGLSDDRYLKVISDTVSYLLDNGVKRVIYDAEHFFSGLLDDKEYAIKTLLAAVDAGADTLVLCDTKGIVRPKSLEKMLDDVLDSKLADVDVRWGFHGHDDKGNAIANTVTFVEHMMHKGKTRLQVQGTMNGYGERCGNANLVSIIPQLVEDLGIDMNVNKKMLTNLAHDIARLTGIPLNIKSAYVGSRAGSNKAGMHLFSMNRGGNYMHTDLDEWGNKISFLLTSMSGYDHMARMAQSYGFDVDKHHPNLRPLKQHLKNLENEGYKIFDDPTEQFLLFNEFFGSQKINISFDRWKTTTGSSGTIRSSETTIYKTNTQDKTNTGIAVSSTKGPVDSMFEAIKQSVSKKYRSSKKVELVDFKVNIAKPMGSKSSVIVYITFADNGNRWRTQSISENFLEASHMAITKGFEYHILKKKFKKPKDK